MRTARPGQKSEADFGPLNLVVGRGLFRLGTEVPCNSRCEEERHETSPGDLPSDLRSNVGWFRRPGQPGRGGHRGRRQAGIVGQHLREDVFDQRFNRGRPLGGFPTYSLSDRFAVQPEVLFVMKGPLREHAVRRIQGNHGFQPTWKSRLAKYILACGPVSFNVSAGPALALKLSAKVRYQWKGYRRRKIWKA
jgi:hypothetical protein